MGEARRRREGALPLWTPFERATATPMPEWKVRTFVRTLLDEGMAATEAEAEETVRNELARQRALVWWQNSRYQVQVAEAGEVAAAELVWLSIKRLDKAPVGPERFRDFQRIKNELVGPECEAVEVYPAESRLVDTSNQYHLWVVRDQTFRWPFGFDTRLVQGKSSGGAVQKPFEEE